jgi:hypothetical protein
MEMYGWQFLPSSGGILDQDQALMQDLSTITWRKGYLEKAKKSGGVPEATLPGQVKNRVQQKTRPGSE